MTESKDVQNLKRLLLQGDMLDAIQRRLMGLDVLQVFGITNQETAHSRFWAWLLDPNGSHVCGHRFLRAFLRMVTADLTEENRPFGEKTLGLLEVEGARLEEAVVGVEVQPVWMKGKKRPEKYGEGNTGDKVAERRFDVFIDLALGGRSGRAAVVVEMKVKAKESIEQTRDYGWSLEHALTMEDGYSRALAVFLDWKDGDPKDEHFLPFGLAASAEDIIGNALRTNRDLMSREVAWLLEQYTRSVTLSAPDTAVVPAGFLEEHKEALACLRGYLDWTPSFSVLAERLELDEGTELQFRDRRGDEPKHGRLRRSKRGMGIAVVHGDNESDPLSLNQAAKAAGRGGSQNAWLHWNLEGKTLDEWRREITRDRGDADPYCASLVNGRTEAIRYLLSAAVVEHVLPENKSSTPSRSLLLRLVEARLLQEGQQLYYNRDPERIATVQVADGGVPVLRVDDTRHQAVSPAATQLAGGSQRNGFTHLWYRDADGQFRRLDDLRRQLDAATAGR